MPIPGERDVPVVVTIELELTLGELTHVWTLGVGSNRSLGRPKEWNGEPTGFDDFAFKFSNWLSGLPGDARRFLEDSAKQGSADHVGDAGGTRKDRSQRRRNRLASTGVRQRSELHPTSS